MTVIWWNFDTIWIFWKWVNIELRIFVFERQPHDMNIPKNFVYMHTRLKQNVNYTFILSQASITFLMFACFLGLHLTTTKYSSNRQYFSLQYAHTEW